MDRRAYTLHRIPKRTGGWREILEPNPELKRTQRAMLQWLMARQIRPGPYAQAFVRRRSIVTHAAQHVGKRVLVRIDIRNFFPSVLSPMVRAALIREGLRVDQAEHVCKLCTVDDRLPQGAPTSPFLANIVFKPVDFRLGGLARAWTSSRDRTSYSRYADDLVFSSDDLSLPKIVHPVRRILEAEGFEINRRKTRTCRSGNRQITTGIVVNHHPNIPRSERRAFRARLHNLRMGLRLGSEPPPVNWQELRGKAAYFQQVNPDLGRNVFREIGELQRLAGIA